MTMMVSGIATSVIEQLVSVANREVSYFCCFNSHVQDLENKKILLDAKRRSVLKAVEEAKKRNETQVEDEVQCWIQEADNYIFQEDTKTMKKCFFGWCPNCFWQYRRGKMVAKRTRDITDLIGKCNFDRVARGSELPGIKYYSSQNFIDFECRKSELQKLVKALEDESCSMIGLYGMGGTGKTTLAQQVGIQVENSKAFERVIFVVVSSPPDIKKIQFNIASQLSLELGEGKEEVLSMILWARIANNGKRVLIILDDMWEKLNLMDIGIPCGPNHRNCCVLITTRHLRVCKAMECQRTIGLQTLTDRDALKLFVEHVGIRSDDSFNEFMVLAQQIVHECGGLPIAVVAIATTLKNWPLKEWKVALETLQRSEPLHNVDEDMTNVYRSLRLSYDKLEESAKYVFLLCSLFPEGYEIPINLLCKLSIGFGLFKEGHNYLAARMKAIRVKDILISSSLLLEAKEVYVKMHSMVREMALWVSNKDLQVIMDSSTTVKSHMRFLYWSTDDFPKQFDGTELEILVLWIKGKVMVEDSYTIFEEMTRLKVLFLRCDSDHKYITLSLKLLHSLKNIRTLILDGWELRHISVLESLHDLEIVELTNCLISELPNEIRDLKNLRSLGLRKCKIERNNPFEVIERCIRLEELDFVLNSNIEDWKEEGVRENIDKVVPDVSPPTLKRCSIACPHLKYFNHDYNGMLNCFNTEKVKALISNVMFKNIVRTVEVLELGEIRGTGWKSLVPDIIPVEDGGMNDLIKLCLYSLVDVECLVDTSSKHLDSDVKIFSNLVELCLDGVDVKELYRGPIISGFLLRLQILKLQNCKKLRNIFFDSNLKLDNLKVLHLINCPMFQSPIFQSSVAQSLEKLEELIIRDFAKLKRIITYESLGEDIVEVDNKSSYSTLFPNLKTLEIEECGKLELVSQFLFDLPRLEAISIRKCEELKYIFGEDRILHQEIMLPSLKKLVFDDVPNFIALFPGCNIDIQRPAPILKDDSEEKFVRRAAFSWARLCCFLPRIKDTDIVVSNATLQDQTISPELPMSTKEIQTFHTAKCLLRPPLTLQNIRQMTIVQCSNLMSLFTISIATTVMLEKLTIQRCDKLKNIITNEEDDYDHIDCISIFPKLEELLIVDCRNMESIFPCTSSVYLKQLKFVIIRAARELKCVFGRFGRLEEYLSNEIENKEVYIDLPALETLSLTDVPNIIGICTDRRQLNLETAKESQASIKGIQTFHTARCLLRQPLKLQNIRQMTIVQCSNLMSLFTISIAKTVMLEKLTIQRCDKLKHVITNDEEDDDHIYCISIFPKLEEFLIVDCRNMEFMFPFTSSVCLQNLKSVIIRAAPKLKYVFGRVGREEHLSNGNENNKEFYIDLPALETISLTNVPNVIGICTNGRQLSLDTAENLTNSQGAEESGKEEIIDVERPMISSVSSDVVNFHNLGEIKIVECRKIKAMFPASTWRSLSQLSKLCILNCEVLAHVVVEDSKDYGHFSDDYVLPKLEFLQIQNCNKLEFILPSSFLGGLPKLKSMIVEKAAGLRYIFGKHDKGDYLSNPNENGKFKINLAALETLSLRDVPNIINICAKRYSVMLPSLQQIGLDNCQELTRDSPNLTVYWKPEEDLTKICGLTNLEVGTSTIEEVFNLEGVKIGGLVTLSLQSMVLKNLSEMKQMCKGPRSILSFDNLRSLKVIGCKRLRAIFSISTLRSLPHLFQLKIKDCKELVHIIEEDPQESDEADDDLQQLSFPRLEEVHIQSCHSLKFLFSISTSNNMFPKLERLEIEEASELKQIFACKLDDTQKIMVVKDAFPSLSYLGLINLPELATICCGIMFQTLPDHQVVDCPKYQEITSQQVQQEPQNLGLDNQAASEALSYMGERSSLRNSAENAWKAMKKNVEEVPTSNRSSEATLPSSSTFKIGLSTEKTLKEIEAKEPTPALEKQAFETSTVKSLQTRASLHGKESLLRDQFDHESITCQTKKPSKRQHVFPRYRICLEEYAKMAKLQHGDQLAIKFEPEIYNQDSEEIFGNELINEILNHEMASTGAINLYIRHLHNQFIVPCGLSQRFRFISPHVVASYEATMRAEKLEEQSRAVANFFIANAKAKDTLFLAPYLQEGHWMLIVINPELPKIWYLDPLNGKASNRLEMQVLFNRALVMYRAHVNLYCPLLKDCSWDSIYNWKEIKCPQQPYQSSDCGYCIMKFMKDIVTHQLNTIPDKYFDDAYCTEYSHPQIEDVIEELAMTVYYQWGASKELKDEQTMMEPIGQLQDQDLGEMKTTIEVPQKTNIPLDDDDLRKTRPRSGTIMTHQQEQGEISAASVIENIPTGIMEPKLQTSTLYSEAGRSQSGPCTKIDKETGKEIDKAVPASKLPTAETSQDSEVLKETAEQGFEEHDKSKDDKISIQRKGLGLRTQSGLSLDNSLAKESSQNLETGKEVVGIDIASEASVTTTSSNSKVDSMKETMGQCFQEHDASPEASIATDQSADLETRKQSKESSVIAQSLKTGKEAGGILLLASQQSSMSTTSTNSESTKEAARGSVETTSLMEATPVDSTVEQKLENASKPNLPNVIPALYHESPQIVTASPSPTLGILQIFQIVELKAGEAALLAKALEQYPQLLLPREQRAHPIIAFSYRVLVDILVILATKTPYTITTSEKSTLENNLSAATLLGFNKGWIDAVRAKVFGVDTSDVSPAQEKVQVMDAKLETCDMVLKQVQEEKEEAKRHLEKAQGQFDAIDSKLLSLLNDRNTLMANIISAKDTPFGI